MLTPGIWLTGTNADANRKEANMNPFYYPFFPPVRPVRRRNCLKQVNIYELPTTGVQVTDTSVDLGINPRLYNELPCECMVILRIRQSIPASAANLPVNVVIPTSASSSTITPSTAGTRKMPVIDHASSRVVGSDVNGFTDAFALLDKDLGILRFVDFRTGAPSSDTPASVKAK